MKRHEARLRPDHEHHLRTAYRDFASPDFRFVEAALDDQRAAAVLRDLAAEFDVVDNTEIDYEVCFTYYVRAERVIVVKLSMVGPYAVLMAFDHDGQSSAALLDGRRPTSAQEARVADVVAAHGFTTLSAEEFDTPVPLALREGSTEVSLYAALFEPDGELP